MMFFLFGDNFLIAELYLLRSPFSIAAVLTKAIAKEGYPKKNPGKFFDRLLCKTRAAFGV